MSAIAAAKDTLLQALEQLELAERELDAEPDRVDLVVVYSIGRRDVADDGAWQEVGGWASTAGPKWLHAAMLRRAADANDEAARAVDDEPDDEEGEGSVRPNPMPSEPPEGFAIPEYRSSQQGMAERQASNSKGTSGGFFVATSLDDHDPPHAP